MGRMGHLRHLVQPVAEDCGELLVLLSLVGVGDREPIEVVEGAEQPPELRSCLEGGRTHQADEHWRDNCLRGKGLYWIDYVRVEE